MRKYLFISYATEDLIFADWLYKKLTYYGYSVWLDKHALKKGESFPAAFPKVIKEETIRFLPILTTHSLQKDNPVKERTTAHNVKNALKIPEFIIPIRLGKIQALDLDHSTVDLNWVDFASCWATGLEELINALESQGIPRSSDPKMLDSKLRSKFQLPEKNETLHANLLSIEALPTKVFRILKGQSHLIPPFYHASEYGDSYYALVLDDKLKEAATLESVEQKIEIDSHFKNVFKGLVQKAINDSVFRRGLRRTDERGLYQFPKEVTSIHYVNYSGKRRYIRTHGHIKQSQFVLAARYTTVWDSFEAPKIRINFKFIFSNANGTPLSPKLAVKKQSKLRKSHYNSRWVQKAFALASFLSQGEELHKVFDNECGQLIISGTLDSYTTINGIHEKDDPGYENAMDDLLAIIEGVEHEASSLQ